MQTLKNPQLRELQQLIQDTQNISPPLDSIQEQKQYWLNVAEWLFTKKNTLRKNFNKKQGVLSVSAARNSQEKKFYQELKQRIHTLRADLESNLSFQTVPYYKEVLPSSDLSYRDLI